MTNDRFELWTEQVNARSATAVAEVGVYRGEFAERMLAGCPSIERYYLIDPWRHLDDWNKPANRDDASFDAMLKQTLDRTESWSAKRVVLRGRTSEVIAEIPDASLDFAYVDGDHTLRGITIDLARVWPKIKPGGVLGGDDFTAGAWQHAKSYEPSAVFPYAVYFAEAVDAPLEALPHNQFAIHRRPEGFSFSDLVGSYQDTTLRSALRQRRGARAVLRSLLRTD